MQSGRNNAADRGEEYWLWQPLSRLAEDQIAWERVLNTCAHPAKIKTRWTALGRTAGDASGFNQMRWQTLITGVCQLGMAKLLPGSAPLLLLLALLPAWLLASWLQVSLRPF